MSRLLNPRGKFADGAVVGPWTPPMANPQDRFDGAAAAPSLAVGAAFYDDFDDFNAPAGNNSVAGRAGWTLSGASVLHTDTAMLGGDGVLIGPWFSSSTGLFGSLCDGPSEVRMTVRQGDISKNGGNSWAAGYHKYYLWRDDDSFVTLELEPGNNRIVMRTQDDSVASGAETGRETYRTQLPGGLVIPNQALLTAQINADNQLRLYLGKVPLRATNAGNSYHDLSPHIAAGHRKGQAGVYAFTRDFPLMSDIAVRASAGMWCIEAGSHRGAGHSVIGGSTGTPDISFRYFNSTGKAITGWAMRLWDATEGLDPTTINTGLSGANADGWKAVEPVSNEAGVILFRPALPTGNWIPQFAMLFDDGSFVDAYAPSILIAKIMLYYGQSIATGRSNSPTTGIVGDPLAGVSAYAYWPTPTVGYSPEYIIHGADTLRYSGSYGTWHTANAVVDITGEPCIAIALGTGGQNLAYLSQGGAGYTALMNVMDQIPGVPELVYLDHGQSQIANPTEAANVASYAGNVISGVINPMRAKWGAGLKFLIGIQGSYAGVYPPDGTGSAGWGTNWTGFNAAVSALRLVQAGMCTEYGGSDPDVHIGGFQVQIDHGDELPAPGVQGGYHYSNNANGSPKLCERDAWSMAKHAYGADVHDSAGPRITGTTRSGAVINVALDMNGAAALTTDSYAATVDPLPNRAGTVWGWFVAADAAPTVPLTISSLDVGGDGESIAITLSADPGAACRVYLWHGGQWDDENAICGAYAQGAPIPIQPSLDVANGRDYFLTAA